MNVVGFRDVRARAKALAGAGDHKGAYRPVAAGRIKRVAQRDPQLRVDCVLAARTIERQRAHPVTVVGQGRRS
jgi:hypothetical protein